MVWLDLTRVVKLLEIEYRMVGKKAKLSHFSRVRLCATPEMAAHQAPPSLEFFRKEH